MKVHLGMKVLAWYIDLNSIKNINIPKYSQPISIKKCEILIKNHPSGMKKKAISVQHWYEPAIPGNQKLLYSIHTCTTDYDKLIIFAPSLPQQLASCDLFRPLIS